MSDLSLERRPDGVAVLRLDRPKLNPLSQALLGELASLLAGLGRDLPKALVVWGGERCFSAGADVSELGGTKEAERVAAGFHRALGALAAFPRATVAAISGYALGGGLELALACDFRIAAAGAKLGQPEVLLGVIPGGGGTQRLARLVGPSIAKDLVLTGRQVSAEEALSFGLVNRVVDKEAVLDEAVGLAAELASGAVLAQALAKRAIDEGLSAGLADGLSLERQLFAEAFGTKDAEVGLASFREHGPGRAEFSGR
ncbi:MAG: enoyl-CoA hydratase/isomerase family protein [Actinomycetota bacterium]|nr:enoyl-CoA hydratase/isomerase family protein [Actinomycetota bacterium]